MPVLIPIGFVQNRIDRKQKGLKWEGARSQIILAPKFKKALFGIEEYSHIVVLFWMDRANKWESVSPNGLFATRIPHRPNPIGLSIVKLVKRTKNVLEVEGLDAFNNTPILDIKPYTGHPRDLIYDFKIPEREERN